MPEENKREVSVKSQVSREEKSQELNILLQKMFGSDKTPDLTKEQIDELLSQKREITRYIHEDKKQDSWDSKFYLVVVLLFTLALSGLVLWKKPDLLNEVLSFLGGLFGGGFAGYGVGSRKR